MPTLLKYDEERGKMHRLEQEVLKLKEQVVSLAEEVGNLNLQKSKLMQELAESRTNRSDTVEEDDMDEFFVVSRYNVLVYQGLNYLPCIFPINLWCNKDYMQLELFQPKQGLYAAP